jgi:transcriptional regulator with XRE-family HTH domain
MQCALKTGPREVGSDREDLRLLVRYLRALRDCDQTEMAADAGIDASSLSRYETGKGTPSRAIVERLAAAAGLSLPFVDALLLPVIRASVAAATRSRSAPAPSPGDADLAAGDTGPLEDEVARLARVAVAAYLAGQEDPES